LRSVINILDFVFSRTNDSLNALINDTLLPADVISILFIDIIFF
jgi:hypothetical protein